MEEHGTTFTPEVARAAERVRGRVRELALAASPLDVPTAPPGGPPVPSPRPSTNGASPPGVPFADPRRP